MRSIVIAGLITLSGCAQPRIVYERPNTSEEQVQQDERECRFEAVRATAGMTGPNPFTVAADRQNAERSVFIACMQARRYTRLVLPPA